jgi:hypothetical protein
MKILQEPRGEISQESSRNKDKFAEDASREQQKISLLRDIATPSLFRTESMAGRAKTAKNERQQVSKVKNDRKAAIQESLGIFHDTGEFPLFEDQRQEKMFSGEPFKVSKGRYPYRWETSQVDGEIIPSDQAYVDMVLDHGDTLPPGSFWADFVTLESLSNKTSNQDKSLSYVNINTIMYNGEPIWRLETQHSCNGKGTWGQSSSCTLMRVKGALRVKVIHKGRTNLGRGWNSRETREYNLTNMIKDSGEAREREVFGQ